MSWQWRSSTLLRSRQCKIPSVSKRKRASVSCRIHSVLHSPPSASSFAIWLRNTTHSLCVCTPPSLQLALPCLNYSMYLGHLKQVSCYREKDLNLVAPMGTKSCVPAASSLWTVLHLSLCPFIFPATWTRKSSARNKPISNCHLEGFVCNACRFLPSWSIMELKVSLKYIPKSGQKCQWFKINAAQERGKQPHLLLACA